MKKGQASVELISVLGISLLTLLVFAVLSTDLLSNITSQKKFAETRDSVQRLAYAADSVYAQGEGASATVTVVIPGGAELNANETFIGKPPSASASIPSTQINIRVSGTDVYANTKAPLSGSFPSGRGTYLMKVTSRGSYVTIGTYLLELDKRSVFKNMARNETRTEVLTFGAAGSSAVLVNITYNQSYGNLNMSVSPGSFTLAAGGSQPVTLTFQSGTAAAGTYNWQLLANGFSQESGAAETIEIPVSIDVQAG